MKTSLPLPTDSNYRWFILALASLTNTLAVAAPTMAMPVLFAEISTELNLDLVQVGVIWGISALPGIATSLLGGAIGDRIGPRRVLIAGCLLVGVFGALRGLSFNFISLAVTMFMLGAVSPLVVLNTLKTCGMWFSSRQLGLASGFLSMGMALGFLLSSMLSATVLSPWLGSWRAVLYLYGAIGIVLCSIWYLARSAPAKEPGAAGVGSGFSLRKGLAHVMGIRNIWLLGLTIMGVSGCIQGTLGYLPLHLRSLGWAPASADAALATFHTISMAFVIPIALGSDKLGTRKNVLAAAGFMMIAGVGLLSLANGVLVWAAVCLAGMVRDGFMAVFMTSVIETKGVGIQYAGTAIGLVMVFGGLGNLLSPALGNSLASVSAGVPFLFWAGLLGIGMIGLLFTRS